jgi:hypothetical protein
MYGLNLERRIFDNILYEVDSSDNPDNYYSQVYHSFCELVQTPSTVQAILLYSKQN